MSSKKYSCTSICRSGTVTTGQLLKYLVNIWLSMVADININRNDLNWLINTFQLRNISIQLTSSVLGTREIKTVQIVNREASSHYPLFSQSSYGVCTGVSVFSLLFEVGVIYGREKPMECLYSIRLYCIVLYWRGGHCCPMHCDLFKIYCARTWICRLNVAQRPIFFRLEVL